MLLGADASFPANLAAEMFADAYRHFPILDRPRSVKVSG